MIVYFGTIVLTVLIRCDETTKQHYGCVIMQSGEAMINAMQIRVGGSRKYRNFQTSFYICLFVCLRQSYKLIKISPKYKSRCCPSGQRES